MKVVSYLSSPTLLLHRSLLIVDVIPLDSLLLVGIWNVVEFCTAIICACLPMVPALLREVFGRDTIKGSSTTYPTSGYRKRQQISSDSRTGLSGETAVPSRTERDDIPLVYSKQTRVQEVAAV